MRITSISEPIQEIRFLNAGKGAGSFYVDKLPVHTATVTDLPDTLDAIVATADLQGRERFEEAHGGPPRLLGEALPLRLAREILPELNLDASRCAAVLAGDFYTVPNLDSRGGSGDVTGVWKSFCQEFRWVAGVAGNHDTFEDELEPKRRIHKNAYYLDGDTKHLDGLQIAGVGGIIGNTRKPQRKSDQEFLTHVELLAETCPDLFLMHDGPDGGDRSLRGQTMVRQLLEKMPPTLIVRGHAHWNTPLVELTNSTQVLNVDCRVVILCRQS